MLLGPHIRPVDDGCPLAARCRTPECGERGRGMFDADAADNRVMGCCDRRWLGAESRRPQGGADGNGRDGRRDVDDRSISHGHDSGSRACSCACSCSRFLRIRGRCRAGSTVSRGPVEPGAASRGLGVRQPDRSCLFLANYAGTRRGAKANIGGQHHEGCCGECEDWFGRGTRWSSSRRRCGLCGEGKRSPRWPRHWVFRIRRCLTG